MTGQPLPASAEYGTRRYGDRTYGDLFTPRQLAALETFSGLVGEARERIREDAGDDYAAAVAPYLAFAVSKMAGRGSSISSWDTSRESVRTAFGLQAIPMFWDCAEANPLGGASGGYGTSIDAVAQSFREPR